MAWKVYDFMEPNGYSRSELYGPLPCKRWEKDPADKRHKVIYRFKYSQRGAESADSYNERRAIEYAKWLARRDGITLPSGHGITASVEWSGFYSATKTRKQTRKWSGTTTEHATYCKRIQAVEWGRKYEVEHFNERKDGRRGAWAYNENCFEVVLRIEIPNWDWEPAEPVEEIIEELALLPVAPSPEIPLAPVAPSFKVPSRFLESSSLRMVA